jgi:cytochrome d ubiquinol oxidase subunit I
VDNALALDRLHFAFTITFHYIFPQLTMGLALLIVVFKTLALKKKEERSNQAALFWARILAVTFVLCCSLMCCPRAPTMLTA